MTYQGIVSVIVPCYNHGQFIREAIASVETCDKRLFEIIIVNDGSTDVFTQQVLRQLECEGYNVINQSNQGLASSRNTAISMAKGSFILPLDADNRIRANYIVKGLDIFEKHPDVSVVYGKPEFCGDLSARKLWTVAEFDFERLLDGNYIDACALFRKSVWEKWGGYDPNMPVAGLEDWDFWVRLAERGEHFYFLDEVLFDYRVCRNSMIQNSSAFAYAERTIEYMCEKHPEMMVKRLKAQLAERDQLLQYAYQSKGYRLSKKYWEIRDLILRFLSGN